jgi:hypothetical protein
MIEILSNIPTWTGPIILMVVNVFVPPIGAFTSLKGQYLHGDRSLKIVIFAKHSFPYLAMIFAFGGLFASMEFRDTILGWGVGFGGLFLAGSVLTLQHVGPFYPLISDLDDLEDKIRRLSETNPTQQGT